MTWTILTAVALFVVGLGVGSTVRSWGTLFYPVIVAAVLVVLILSGILFGQDDEFGRLALIFLASTWTVVPAAIGTLVGKVSGAMMSKG